MFKLEEKEKDLKMEERGKMGLGGGRKQGREGREAGRDGKWGVEDT